VITRRENPIPAYEKAMYDLCFLNPKHKLTRFNINEADKNSHSNVSVANKLTPTIGKKIIINGMIEQ
jgi:hypothetical protein